jgi:23S rRNA (uracil1939-C5)-methyltransferase
MSSARECLVGEPLYGGGFATDCGEPLWFVLRGERVEVDDAGSLLRVVQASPERVAAECRHFGVCGGCQYQMAGYREQLEIKQRVLASLLSLTGVKLPAVEVHAGEAYRYRNRIRLRVERVGDALRFGYNERGSTKFLAIEECPIAARILWETAEALLKVAERDEDVAYWLSSASDVEIFANETLERLQITLSVLPRTNAKQGSIERALKAMQAEMLKIAGVAALAVDPRTGPTGRVIAEAGSGGLAYRVLDETYWIARGGFFQVNRFLLPELVELVTKQDGQPRRGELAWDLFAGVGLFSRVLARSFARVIAVEANAKASQDNQAALKKIGERHEALAVTTVEFLRAAMTQRERPELVVLDPPRAGAGVEACELLNKIGAQSIVYVSCDPTTLARDLEVLSRRYEVKALHVVDLFPQTFHMETVVMMERRT